MESHANKYGTTQRAATRLVYILWTEKGNDWVDSIILCLYMCCNNLAPYCLQYMIDCFIPNNVNHCNNLAPYCPQYLIDCFSPNDVNHTYMYNMQNNNLTSSKARTECLSIKSSS